LVYVVPRGCSIAPTGEVRPGWTIIHRADGEIWSAIDLSISEDQKCELERRHMTLAHLITNLGVRRIAHCQRPPSRMLSPSETEAAYQELLKKSRVREHAMMRV
jgi:hypothetical protein